jgi:hypothetical protein
VAHRCLHRVSPIFVTRSRFTDLSSLSPPQQHLLPLPEQLDYLRLTIPPGVFQSSRISTSTKNSESQTAGGTDTTSEDEGMTMSPVPLRTSSDPLHFPGPRSSMDPESPGCRSPQTRNRERAYSQQVIRTRLDIPSTITLRHPTLHSVSYPYPHSPVRRTKATDTENDLSPATSTRSADGFQFRFAPTPTLVASAIQHPRTYQPLSSEDTRALGAFQLKL